ncbi:MAG TPA: trypsin-like serine protease [Myxococcota bacterium]
MSSLRAALLTSLSITLVGGVACEPDVDVDSTRPSRDDDDDDDNDDGGEGEGESGEGEGEGEAPICTADKAIAGGPNAVYFGTRTPTHVALTTSQQRAVIGIQEGGVGGSVCSGTLIAPTVVLTATHCTEGTRADRFQILFGPDDLNPELEVAVVAKDENPDGYDITMLRLAVDPTTQIDVTPIAAFAGTLRTSDAGEIFEQAGYGATESSDGDGRFFVAEPFIGFEDGDHGEPNAFLRVDGEGRHGVCFGDSGGPSLRQTPEGDVRVMGALSWGDESCVGVDRYTRVDLVQEWVAAFAGPLPLPGSSTVGCGDVDSAGHCSADGRVVEFCDSTADGDVLRTVACGTDEVCGDDVDGKRCIPVSENPCGTATAFGSCSGEVLTWCDGDVARTRDCAVCGGEVCGLVDNVQGYACLPDQCEGLTFEGECDGNVARWCNSNGVAEERDCAADGDTCGYVDDETGFFCK